MVRRRVCTQVLEQDVARLQGMVCRLVQGRVFQRSLVLVLVLLRRKVVVLRLDTGRRLDKGCVFLRVRRQDVAQRPERVW